MIILKNVSTSNPGLARIPMSFASSAITDYIRNLCLWRTKTQYAINAYPHVHHDFFALCVQGPHREAAWVNLDKVRRKTSLHLLPLQKPKWGQVVRFSENLTKNSKQNLWNSENRNGITRVIENLEQHKRWIRVPTRLMVILSSSTKSQKSNIPCISND